MLAKMMRVLGKLAEMALVSFFLAVILLFFLPRLFHISQHVVLSGSMEPAIKTGSLCFIDHRVGYETIKEGDIIAFGRIDGSLVVHRVVRKDQGKMNTKGDANEAEDLSFVTSKEYLGKAVLSIPCLGYAAAFLQRKESRAAVGILAATFFLAEIIHVLLKREDKNYEKT